MERRSLEITVMSAKDLNKVNLITKMDVYVVVSISGDANNQKTKTPVDHSGDNNPTWNFPVKFTVDNTAVAQNRLTLVFKVRCQRALGDKDIGEVHVPVKELRDSASPLNGTKQILSYQIRKPSGKPKGQLTFSYQFSDKVDQPVTAVPVVGSTSHVYPPPPVTYAPPPPVRYPPVSAGYPPVAAPYGYPPPPQPVAAQYSGYPPAPPQQGYGYPPPPPQYGGYGYGYPPVQRPPKKNNNLGLGLGAGLLGGAIGGLLIGDAISDVAAYDSGYDAGFGDSGGFDF